MAAYFIDSISGLDTNNGTSTGTPWQTLNKVNSSMGVFAAGDTISFKCNDVFYGSLSVNTNGSNSGQVTFNSYGSGTQPVITGFVTISGWTSLGGGIYQSNALASVGTGVNVVTVNGTQYGMGRYPATNASNGGYLTISAASGNSVTTLSTIPNNFTGGTIVARTQHWRLDTATITGQTSNTLTYGNGFSNTPAVGFGFFIQNHLSTLANFGDWFFDTTTNTIKMYFGSGGTAGYVVQASSIDALVTLQSPYNTFSGLSFSGGNLYAFTAQSLKLGTLIQNCTFSFIGTDGLYFSYQDGCLIENCIFNYCNSTAINMAFQNTGTTIINNTITNIGTIAGAGKGGFYEGISNNQSCIVTGNSITNTGYNGISFGGINGNNISNNYISTYCTLTDDGGGIYGIVAGSGSTANIFDHNIIINGVGNNFGTIQTGQPLAHGIYFDIASTGFTCSNNTIVSAPDSGIFLHGTHNYSVIGNTVYNCGVTQLLQQDNGGRPADTGVITGNTLFAASSSQLCINWINGGTTDSALLIGTINNNTYCRPTNENNIIDNQYNVSHHYFNLTGWTAMYGYDSGSTVTPPNYLSSTPTIYYNNTNITSPITLLGVWNDMQSNIKSGTVTLQPYSSLLILQLLLGYGVIVHGRLAHVGP